MFGNGGTPGAIPASMETGCGLQQYPGPVFGRILKMDLWEGLGCVSYEVAATPFALLAGGYCDVDFLSLFFGLYICLYH